MRTLPRRPKRELRISILLIRTRFCGGEIEARDLELAELGRCREHAGGIERESAQADSLLEESLNRLQREMQEQSMESAERVRELKAEIEHLKITRFQAKRENYSIKTSLSWRLTWPLRVLRDAGRAFVSNRDPVRFVFERPAFIPRGRSASTCCQRIGQETQSAGYRTFCRRRVGLGPRQGNSARRHA